MSTDYAPLKKISAFELFDGRLEECGVQEHINPDTKERERCLTDGRNYLWVFINEDGFVSDITRYGGNAPSKILDAIGRTFDTYLASEAEPQYWRFYNEEDYYLELLKYLHGEPNDIGPGTLGMSWAEIGKSLVEKTRQ